MKKRLVVSLFTILTAVALISGLAACGGSSSEDDTPDPSEGLEYTLDGNVYRVTGIGKCKDSEIVIPSEHDGRPVVGIDAYAFYNCDDIIGVVIPDMVLTIGDYAFYSCEGLKSVTISKSVTSIGEYAFYECTAIEKIIYDPVLLTEVSDTSFFRAGQGGNGITVTIGADVSEIPAYLFCPYDMNADYAPKITSVDYDEGCLCSVVNSYAFYECRDLVSLTLPDSVSDIWFYAFYDCVSLKSVTLPKSLYYVDDYAFRSPSLKYVYYNCEKGFQLKGLLYDSDQDGVEVTIGKSVTEVPYRLLYDFDTVTRVYFEGSDTCTEIGDGAFYGCSRLTSVVVPDSVTSIGADAFYECTSLESLTIGTGVTTVGTRAFYDTHSLVNLYFNAVAMDDLTSSHRAFFCAGDEGAGIVMTVDAGVTRIPAYLFYSYSYATSSSTSYKPKVAGIVFEVGSVCGSIGEYAFYECYDLTSVAIPDNVTTVGEYAFRDCAYVTDLTIGAGIKTVGIGAFYGWYRLTNLQFDAVAMDDLSQNNNVFRFAGSNTGITLTIGAKVTEIPAYLFYPYNSSSSDAPKITTVVFEQGSVCRSIGNYAFYYCSKITAVYYGGSENDWSGISVGSSNGNLTSVTIYYYSEKQPSSDGNFWHYDEDGNPTEW